MYQDGKGVKHDIKEAMKWYLKAAEQGDIYAQFNLALIFENGKNGVDQDYKEAMKYYRLAAEQGDAGAQFNLGFMYGKGEGALRDYKESVKWYLKAAEQGHAKAQYNLGFMYVNGQGVKKDYSRAHMWLDLSVINGEDLGNRALDLIVKEMTPVQIAKAKNMAKECKQKKYKNCY